jgi:type I restriction enzyme M protein
MRPARAIADENEELGGALPRNYNSLEKPILRELLKILNSLNKKNTREYFSQFAV